MPEEEKITRNEPVFVGNYALISFDADPGPGNASTIWLLDKNTQELRPFLSEGAFNNFFKENPQDAWSRVQQVSIDELGENGALEGFSLLDEDYGIDTSGILRETETGKTRLRYGNAVNEESERLAYTILNGLLSLSADNEGISSNVLNNIKNNPDSLAMYIGALAYGGYQPADILLDFQRKSLIESGDNNATNMKVISSDVPRSQFVNTPEYKTAISYPNLQLEGDLANVSSDLLEYPVANLPDEAFKELVPTFDYQSPEFKQKMDDVESAYFDVLLQTLSAQTEQQKAVADYNWDLIREAVEEEYGIALEKNAIEAWNQIEGLRNKFTQRGLRGSGIFREALDKYLANVRKSNKLIREQKGKSEEIEQASWYQKYASPEDIQKLIQEDEANGIPREESRAIKWGLVPSAETVQWFSKDNLKKLYPNLSDEEIDRYRNIILDENGNFRSNLYQKYFSNKSGLEEEYRKYKQDMVYNEALLDEEDAYEEFTKAESPFLRATEATSPEAPSEKSPDTISDSIISKSSDINTWSINPNNKASNKVSDVVPARDMAKEKSALKEWGAIYGKMPSTSKEWADFNKFAYQTSKGTGETITGYTPEGRAVKVKKGKYYPGISLKTPETTKTTSTTNETFRKAAANAAADISKKTTSTWKAPSGYQKISSPTDIKKYHSHMQDPTGKTMYGVAKTKISNPEYLSKYKENEIERIGSDIYLKKGVKQRW